MPKTLVIVKDGWEQHSNPDGTQYCTFDPAREVTMLVDIVFKPGTPPAAGAAAAVPAAAVPAEATMVKPGTPPAAGAAAAVPAEATAEATDAVQTAVANGTFGAVDARTRAGRRLKDAGFVCINGVIMLDDDSIHRHP